MSQVCALELLNRILRTAYNIQVARMAVGDYDPLPWLAPLYLLCQYVRLGVCTQTRLLDYVELPDLPTLVAQLPFPFRVQVMRAIKCEQAGQVVHPSFGWWNEQAETLPQIRSARLA